jgi:hypothetical protein
MSAPRRIWVDVTGIRPGSDSAIFADRLIGGFRRLSVDAILCCRDRGLRVFQWPELAQTHCLPVAQTTQSAVSVWRLAWDGMPGRTRRAIRHFLRLQKAVLAGRRGTGDVAAPETEISDTAVPRGDDVLLMLGTSGDASRFADAGVRLAVLLVDAAPILRPDWLARSQQADFDRWLRTTLPHVSVALSVAGPVLGRDVPMTTIAGAPILLRGPTLLSVPPSASSRPFVLAAGPIGAAGQTRHLLLAWRRLMDMTADLPDLVIAGEIGPLADDVLAQLRHSDGLGGKVILVRSPSVEFTSMLMRDCLFCIAMEAPGGWGRTALDAADGGKPCLEAGLHAENAARLASDISQFLVHPPTVSEHVPRSWDDVARDVLLMVSA